MSEDGLPPLREVIRELSLTARRSLGQNFILDLNLTRRIARIAGPLEGRCVIEVGPGPGGLTRGLLMEGAGEVVAVERDRRFLPALHRIAERYPGRLRVVEGDALDVDLAALAAGTPALIVANLPYNVATSLLVGWLEAEPWPPWWVGMVLMFQREVAERLAAGPGSKSYGRLSVLAQWRSMPRIRMTLPPAAFTPQPKVESAVVELRPLPAPPIACSVTALAQVTAAAFGQRRKMLRSSLARVAPDATGLLGRLGLSPEARAEQLAVADFCRIAAALEAQGTTGVRQ
jgi:16S rRNA (adenine1518-N6/adenine1519-N6)-dimethyltransferase